MSRIDENTTAKLVEKSQQENNELLALLQANINDNKASNESNKPKENYNDDDSIHSSDILFSDSSSDISDL